MADDTVPLPPGQAPAPQVPTGQAAYQANVTKYGQEAADVWRERYTHGMVEDGKKPSEIQAFWGNSQPYSPQVMWHVQTQFRRNTGQTTDLSKPTVTPPTNFSLWDAAKTGFMQSNWTLEQLQNAQQQGAGSAPGFAGAVTAATGPAPSGMDWLHSSAYQIGSLYGNAKDIAMGGVVGLPGVLAGPIGGRITMGYASGAWPAAHREMLVYALKHSNGGIMSASDYFHVAGQAMEKANVAGASSAVGFLAAGPAEGAAGSVAGKLGNPLATIASRAVAGSGAMAVASELTAAAMEGHAPSWDNIWQSMGQNILLSALTGGAEHVMAKEGEAPVVPPRTDHTVAHNGLTIYSTEGLPLEAQGALAQADPVVRQEVTTQDTEGNPVTPKISLIAPPEPPGFPKQPAPYHSHRQQLMTGTSWSEQGKLPGTKSLPDHEWSFRDVVEHTGLEAPLVGSDKVVSKPAIPGNHGGAVGRHQITPAFAKSYDSQIAHNSTAEVTELLKDPRYNQMIFDRGMDDIEKRYPHDPEAQAVAYNAGKGAANKFLTEGHGTRLEAVLDHTVRGGIRYVTVEAGRNEADLNLETQRYLANARRLAMGTFSFTSPQTQDKSGAAYDSDAYDNDPDVKARSAEVNFEVSPDGGDKDVLARFNALAPTEKAEISHSIAHEIMPRVAAEVGMKPGEWELHHTIGSYEGNETPGLALQADSTARAKAASDILAHALSQKEMLVHSKTTNMPGSKLAAVLSVALPRDEYAQERASEVFERLNRHARDEEAPFSGYTYNHRTGHLEIAVPGQRAAAMNVRELEDKAGLLYKGQIKVGDRNIFYGPGSTPKNMPFAETMKNEVQAAMLKYLQAKEKGTPIPGPASAAASVSAANMWDTASEDDVDKELLSNMQAPPTPKSNTMEAMATTMLSELSPARAVDNELIKLGMYDRTRTMGTEDVFRSSYGSDGRATVFMKTGPLKLSMTKSGEKVTIDENGPSAVKAFAQVRENGGTLDGFKAALAAARAGHRMVVGQVGKQLIASAKESKASFAVAEKAAKQAQKELDAILSKAKPKGKGTSLEGDRDAIMASPMYKDKLAEANNLAKTAQAAKTAMQRAIKMATPTDTGFNPFAVAKKMDDPAMKTQEKYGLAMDTWTKTSDAVLDYMTASDMMTPARHAAMREMDPTYAAFTAVMSDSGIRTRPGPRGPHDPIRSMVGNDGKVLDVVGATFDGWTRAVREADRARAVGWVVKKAVNDPDYAALIGFKARGEIDPNYDAVDRELKAHGFSDKDLDKARDLYGPMIALRQEVKLKNNEFTYFENGKLKHGEVGNPLLASLLRGRSSIPEAVAVEKVVRWIAQTERAGITLDPTFGARMALWHQMNQFSFGIFHPTPYLTWMRGITHVLANGGKGDALYRELVANGGMGAAMTDMDNSWRKDNGEALFNETNTWKSIWNMVQHPIELAHLVNVKLDAANRVGNYLVAKKHIGGGEKAAMVARVNGLDYAERAAAEVVNRMAADIPFFRPHWLGMKQTYQTFEDNGDGTGPGGGLAQKTLKVGQIATNTIGRWVATISLPAAALWYLSTKQDEQNKDKPGYKAFSDINRGEKDRMMITPEIDGVRFKLRYPANIGFGFGGMVTRILDTMYKHDPAATRGMMEAFMADWVPTLLPAAVLTPIENMTNYSFSDRRPLVSGAMQELSPPNRFNESTSDTGRAVAKLVDAGLTHVNEPDMQISPIQVDHLVKGWGGWVGQGVLEALDIAANKPATPQDLANNIFVKAILIQHTEYQQPQQDFYEEGEAVLAKYDDLAKATKQARATNSDEDQAAVEAAQNEVQSLPSKDSIYNYMKALSMARMSIVGITHNKDMSVDDKRQSINEIEAQMTAISKEGLATIRGEQ